MKGKKSWVLTALSAIAALVVIGLMYGLDIAVTAYYAMAVISGALLFVAFVTNKGYKELDDED